jgi:hypothetical protein
MQGIGDKFISNLVTGSGSISNPIYTNPVRSDLARNYRSLTIRELAMGHGCIDLQSQAPVLKEAFTGGNS